MDFISSSNSFSVLASTIPVAVAPCLVCSIANGRYGPSFGSGTHLLTPQFIYRYLIIFVAKRLCYSLCGKLVYTNNFLRKVKIVPGSYVFWLLVIEILIKIFQKSILTPRFFFDSNKNKREEGESRTKLESRCCTQVKTMIQTVLDGSTTTLHITGPIKYCLHVSKELRRRLQIW